MSAPTFGHFREDPDFTAMDLGDWTTARWVGTSYNTIKTAISELGVCERTEFNPNNGVFDGKIYLMKIDRGTLISIRPVYNGAWGYLSQSGFDKLRKMDYKDPSSSSTYRVYISSVDDLIKYQTQLDKISHQSGGGNAKSLNTTKDLQYEWVKDVYYSKRPMLNDEYQAVRLGLFSKKDEWDANDQFYTYSKDDYHIQFPSLILPDTQYARITIRFNDDPETLNVYA